MCGIYSIFSNLKEGNHSLLRDRGPDDENVVYCDGYCFAFYHLKISGEIQPYFYDDIILLCNGEIYNDTIIHDCTTTAHTSDIGVIAELYKRVGIKETIRMLDGEFAFILYDRTKKLVHFGRDRYGVKPLYYVLNNGLELASLPSCLATHTSECVITHVAPTLLYTFDCRTNKLQHTEWYTYPTHYTTRMSINTLGMLLRDAVLKRVQHSIREVGFLLSGGLDSSIILSIVLANTNLRIQAFTFGFNKLASDVVAAKKLVKWFNNKYDNRITHHVVLRTVQEGFEIIPCVVGCLYTYDTTTIRASTPMYMLSQYIKEKTDVKVILSGEGADELLGGYLYMRYAPNSYEYYEETKKLLSELYLYDCLRADRTTAVHGLEIRPPFLDRYLVEYVLQCAPTTSPIDTKLPLREFAKLYNLLPDWIYLGRKEAFSDAVGHVWLDYIKQRASYTLKILPYYVVSSLVPKNDVEKMFQGIFYSLFGNQYHLLKKYWMPNQQWVDTNGESSARALDIY